MKPTHPNADVLGAFAAGRLEASASTEIEAHLNQCDACTEALERLTVHDSLQAHLRTQTGTPGPLTPAVQAWMQKLKGEGPIHLTPEDEDVLRRGYLGRYRVLGKLGAGGMGSVYRGLHEAMN